ncbi:MAG: hypothetical protein L6R38_007240 [Xanthoria sp. 2 TBL-2021]|nr:MAG: hypothetical protein L6R38_007240 [Xanthoria sp. 2 TBL-2021]
MHLITFSIIFVSYVLASEPVSPASTSDNVLPPAFLISTPSPQPQIPYLELRHLGLDRRQIQPAAVGAPAQVAAGAAQQPNGGAAAPAAAPKVPAANPVAPVANPVAPVAQAPTTTPITPLVPTVTPAVPVPGAVAPVAPVAPAVNGPATALTVAPPPKSGSIGLGTLTGKVGAVRTQEAKSEAGLAAGNRFGFMAAWPSAFKVGASLLLGMAVGVGILL